MVEEKNSGVMEEESGHKGVRIFPALMALMTVLFVGVPSAFATDGNSGDMATLTSSLDTVTTLVGKVWNMVLSNPLLTLFMAVSLLFVGIRVFAAIKGVSRH